MSDQIRGGSGYAPMPAEPSQSPSAPGLAPAPVANAVRLMFLRAVLGVVGIIVAVATKDALKTQIRDSNRTLDEAELDTLLNVALAIGVVIGIVFVVAYVLLALKVRAGRNWARIVTWVLAGLGILSGLAGLAQPAPAISRVFSLVTAVVDVVIVVLLLQRPANEYFRKRT